jgi:succinoglycan biosynthesis transport protein ExoP
MSVREHFSAIWRRRWVVLGLTLLVTIVVYAWSDRQAPTFQSTAQVSVTPGVSQSGSGSASTDTLFLTDGYAQLGNTAPVIGAAVRASHLPLSEQEAVRRLTVAASSSVAVINVTAKGPSVAEAQALAAAEANALIDSATAQQTTALANQLKAINGQIASVTNQLAAAPPGSSQASALQSQLQALQQVAIDRQSRSFDELDVISPATVQHTPVSPKPKTDALLAFVTSLVVFSEGAVLLELVGDRFPADDLEEEVTKLTGLPVLAHVPDGDGVPMTEAFRKLRATLLFMTKNASTRTVAVIGSDPGSGKTFVSVNLAVALAELESNVLLVDGDMRRPIIHRQLGLVRSPGLSDTLLGRPVSSVVQRPADAPRLRVLSAGKPASDPSGLLALDLADSVFAAPLFKVNGAGAFVIVDTPPEALFPDALTIAAQCNLTIIVVDARNGRRRALRRCIEQLNRIGAEPLGVVINRSTAVRTEAASYYTSGHRRMVRWSDRLRPPSVAERKAAAGRSSGQRRTKTTSRR